MNVFDRSLPRVCSLEVNICANERIIVD